jgi:acetyl esterase/lipase
LPFCVREEDSPRIGSLHEGFPHAVELSKKGYNAFVLKYRVGSELRAAEDLSAAVSYIIKRADMFEVSVENYSLWGFSAGARMAGNIALSGTAGFGGVDLPKPCMVVIAYTGQSSFSEDYPPAFITVSEDDPIVNISVADRRVQNLRNAGTEVEYRKYKNAGHGFGLGIGTDADGGIEHAIRFWENHF